MQDGEPVSGRKRMNRRLRQVRRLRQSDETWEGTSRLGRMWIAPRDGPPYRPYVNVFVSTTGTILRTVVLEEPPTPYRVFEDLLQAMRRPMLGAGRARRPKLIYLDDLDFVTALAPRLVSLDVRCEYRHSLPALEGALYSMETRLNKREPTPGLLKLPSVTPSLVGHLCELAADFFQATPWRWLNDSHPMEIRYPPEDKPRYAVVMGSGGEVFGLAVYDALHDLRLMYRRDISPQQAAKMAAWSVLFFEEATAMNFDDLDAMEEYGWPVAAENAYPVFGRTTGAGEIVAPTRQDVFWMEGALAGVLAYLRKHRQVHQGVLQPVEVTLHVATTGGEVQIYLRVPAFE